MAALCSAAAYPHDAPYVRMLETHISRFFLAGDFVCKFRKPVKFDYVDFSTLQRRKADCEQELTCNQCLAPHLYLDVVLIALTPGEVAPVSQGRARQSNTQ